MSLNDTSSFVGESPKVVRLDDLSPIFIHRILLTDPSEFDSLTLSGAPRPVSISFYQHVHHTTENQTMNVESLEQQISNTMQRAYHDMILASMRDLHSYSPLQSMLLEVLNLIQTQILPNRKDFTEQFTSMTQIIQNCDTTSLMPLLRIMIHMGERLTQLESEERSESTFHWIQIAKSTLDLYAPSSVAVNYKCFQEEEAAIVSIPVQDDGGISTSVDSEKVIPLTFPQFGLASITYLLEKTQQCISDMDDWKLAYLIAPMIHLKGKEFEYNQFKTKFGIHGSEDVVSAAKFTRTWVKEIMETTEFTSNEIMTSQEKRRLAVLQIGWVNNILFRSPRIPDTSTTSEERDHSNPQPMETEPFHMPEILHMDIDAVRIIRTATLLSVACSALALHAVTVAKVNDSILKISPLESHVEECRLNLISTLKNGAFFNDQHDFEKHVGEALIQLALALNSNLSEEDKVILKNRAVSVMKNEDPVIKLLDNRMRQIFRSMASWKPTESQVPTLLKTGYAKANRDHREDKQSPSELFKTAAREEFVRKGFAFNAEELAESALLSSRVINLAIDIFGDSVLDKLFFENASH